MKAIKRRETEINLNFRKIKIEETRTSDLTEIKIRGNGASKGSKDAS